MSDELDTENHDKSKEKIHDYIIRLCISTISRPCDSFFFFHKLWHLLWNLFVLSILFARFKKETFNTQKKSYWFSNL